jgi:hypothetical protein
VRLVLAIVSFVLAALMIGFGIAQRTVLATPDHVTASVSTSSPATVTVIDGATLNSFDRSQTLMAKGSDTIFAAYGRTTDVLAWVGKASYNAITFDPVSQKLVSTLVQGTETEVPDPAGSDLWLADYTQSKELGFTINVPEDISVMFVSDGIKPAPPAVSVTWLLDNSTPFAGPLVLGGTIVFLIGLAFLLWAVNNVRKARGPRRKQPKLPKVPRKPTYKPVKRGAPQPAAITRGRRSASMVAVPSLLVGVMLLSACASDAPTTLDNGTAIEVAATGDPTNPADGQSTHETPAVTVPQARRIVTRVSAAVTEADTTLDPVLAATRLDGAALSLRTSNYAIRKVSADYAAPAAIPPSTVSITLPQKRDSWPRTVFVVVQAEDATVAPQALMLIQDDPRSQYKVHYAVALEPGTVMPDVANASIGTSSLDSEVKFFTMAPIDIGPAYADILINDTDSTYYDKFQADGDTLRVAVGKAAKAARVAQIPSTAQLTFANAVGKGQVITLATNDGGALVAVDLTESETIKPIEAGAAVNAPADVAALLGKALSTKGITANYGDQLLFYVPSTTKGGKIVLLGYSQGLISAAEL